jgi:2-hydroxycyclohexanecarboxyl-CoA dehydrogenase
MTKTFIFSFRFYFSYLSATCFTTSCQYGHFCELEIKLLYIDRRDDSSLEAPHIMAESSLRLNDKTIVLAGPFGLLVQNLITQLTEFGSDVAVLTDDFKSAQRVCQNIMDMREVSEKYGRAAAIEVNFHDEKQSRSGLSRSAELFGSTDVYIDTFLWGAKIPFYATAGDGPLHSKTTLEAHFQSLSEASKIMSQAALTFLKSRARGRMLYLFHELDCLMADKVGSKVFSDYTDGIVRAAKEYVETHTAINALAVGVNEEYLLSRFSKTLTIQKALQELLKYKPDSRLIDYNDISQVVAYLVSPLANGISGQVIHLNNGI